MPAANGTLAVVGLGLIGGSVALDGTEAGWRVVATDVDPVQRDAARAAGVEVVDDLSTCVVGADLVVVATPAPEVARVLGTVDEVVDQPVVASSVASVQAPHALGIDPDGFRRVRHVGGHPMTGTERSGFRAARRGMFDGSPWIVTARPTDDRGAVATVLRLALGLRAAPVVLPPDEHDRTVALLSHLPHVLAYTTYRRLRVSDRLGSEHLAGGSFRDATRVAATRPDFWAEVLHRNRTAVADLVADVRSDLAELEALLRAEEGEDELLALLGTGHREVGRPRPVVPAPTRLADDRPGVGPLGDALLDELTAHARAGLAVEGWTADGTALTWTPL